MDLLEGLLKRRSIRRYTDQQVDDTTLEEIIKLGMYAPSAVNKQPWHFVIFRDKNTVDKLVEVHPKGGLLKKAPAAILVCYDTELQHDEGYGPVDCSAATQNILLAAHAKGLGACWIGVYPRQERIEVLQQTMNLPEHVIPFAVISLGYPAEQKDTPERFKPDRIHFEKW